MLSNQTAEQKQFTLTFELNTGGNISMVCYQMKDGYEIYLAGRLIRTKATKQWAFELRKILKK